MKSRHTILKGDSKFYLTAAAVQMVNGGTEN